MQAVAKQIISIRASNYCNLKSPNSSRLKCGGHTAPDDRQPREENDVWHGQTTSHDTGQTSWVDRRMNLSSTQIRYYTVHPTWLLTLVKRSELTTVEESAWVEPHESLRTQAIALSMRFHPRLRSSQPANSVAAGQSPFLLKRKMREPGGMSIIDHTAVAAKLRKLEKGPPSVQTLPRHIMKFV